jgi:hypothetical protein
MRPTWLAGGRAMPPAPPPLSDAPVVVEIAVGREHFRTGVVTLAVRSDGAMECVQERAGRRRAWSGRLAPERVAMLHPIGLAPHVGDRDPDDDPVQITTAAGVVREMRYSDRFTDPQLDELLRAWQQIVEELTDGALPYGEPA